MMNADWSHRQITAGGIGLHCVEAGRGAPVILLHGFPEFWYSWRHQLPALAEAGFQAVAPDLRGYNESDRPSGVSSYRITKLVEDVVDLIRTFVDGPAFVVGHDWGGVLAWKLAALYPHLVRKLAILNAPHPAAFLEELKRSPGQWLRSSYVLFFQLPWLPELVLRAWDFALLKRAWRSQPVHPHAFEVQDIAACKQALRRPGGLTGPLNYYRAALRYPVDLYGPPQAIPIPTMLLWGECDRFLPVSLTEGLGRWVPELRVERIPDASHWIQNDVPEQVNRLLIGFFAE